ncbi:hypothetical protein [Yoonia sediminilitoris]|uniref:Uncharacterized protein n=1 Tax=Yoonia sediminilitoris TaxID=1286148 RepID=A0A2T6KR85_9RHOB|nr:hypothetical protein [Yoonia sediminilitoris]PUB19072.1 hypothetical protein C8N45_101663 [Yoonia sediminilitoris]RCW99240.1 hypothetical protein DFP92_101663 [Yoonia sediminilitoris]
MFIDIWLLLYGAAAGLVAVLLARGRQRMIKGALLGAATMLVLQLLRFFV